MLMNGTSPETQPFYYENKKYHFDNPIITDKKMYWDNKYIAVKVRKKELDVAGKKFDINEKLTIYDEV